MFVLEHVECLWTPSGLFKKEPRFAQDSEKEFDGAIPLFFFLCLSPWLSEDLSYSIHKVL